MSCFRLYTKVSGCCQRRTRRLSHPALGRTKVVSLILSLIRVIVPGGFVGLHFGIAVVFTKLREALKY
jgi:hypothetical protein